MFDIDPEDVDSNPSQHLHTSQEEIQKFVENEQYIDSAKYKGRKVDTKDIPFLRVDNEKIEPSITFESDIDIDYEPKQNQDDEISVASDSHEITVLKQRELNEQHIFHVRNQLKFWNKTMGIRIRIQPILINYQRFPKKPKAFPISNELKDSVDKTFSNLLVLQDKLLVNSSTFSSQRKRSKISFKEDPSNLEKLWKSLNKENNQIFEECEEVFDAWQNRLENISENQNTVFHKPISQQVNETFANVKSIVARNQQRSGNFKQFGVKKKDNNNPLDKTIFNDTVFYQQLLKNFISFSGSHNLDINSRLLFKRESKRKRKNVDVKASKARRLKYVMHPKLVNFAPNEPDTKERLENQKVDRIFNSLFAF